MVRRHFCRVSTEIIMATEDESYVAPAAAEVLAEEVDEEAMLADFDMTLKKKKKGKKKVPSSIVS